MEESILNIVQVDTAFTSLEPPILEIFAYGVTRTSGWINGKLIPHIYLNPPADGIYSFDFVANTPEYELQPATRVMDVNGEFVRGITASFSWENFPADLQGVRIHALRNKLCDFESASVLRDTA